MARDFAKSFYASKEWKKCRATYIAHRKSIDGGLCESCNEKPGYIVHHKTELTPENIHDPDIALGLNNLKYDCLECHNQENGRGSKEVPGLTKYAFDADGNAITI